MIGEKPICYECKHFHRDSLLFECDAFPDGIPDEIAQGENQHTEPLPDQKNKIVFEKGEDGLT